MKNIILIFLILFLAMPCFAAWNTGVPDDNNHASTDVPKMLENNNFLEDFFENHFFYIPTSSTTAAGFDYSDASAALFIGPLSQTYDTTPAAITGRSTKKGDLRAYGANMIPMIYNGTAWKFSTSYLPQFANDSDAGACVLADNGHLYWNTTTGYVRQCSGTSWINLADAATSGLTSITDNVGGGSMTGSGVLKAGAGIEVATTAGTMQITNTYAATALTIGNYNPIPGITLWLDSTSPPEYSTCTIDSLYVIPCMNFDASTDEKIHFMFDVPIDYKDSTNIIVRIASYPATAEAKVALFEMDYGVLKPDASMSLSNYSSTCTPTYAATAAMKVNAMTVTGSYISGLNNKIVGTIFRNADDGTDTFTYDSKVISIDGYYQKKNN